MMSTNRDATDNEMMEAVASAAHLAHANDLSKVSHVVSLAEASGLLAGKFVEQKRIFEFAKACIEDRMARRKRVLGA